MIEVSHIRNYDQPLHEGTMLIESDADYVKACHALRESFSQKGSLKIWVRQRWHFDWLRNFTEQTNIPCTFSEKTPRIILAEKWNVTIPEWLDDETVTDQNLLAMDVDVEYQVGFGDRMLVFFLGQAFYAEKLESGNLSGIVAAMTRPEVSGHFNSYPVLNRCFEEKVSEWERRSNQAWVKKVCSDLLNDPEKLWKELTLWSLLAGYPKKLLEYVVTAERALFLQNVPSEAISGLPLHRVAIEQASTQIEMFFKDLGPSVKSNSDFYEILKCVSGQLEKEFQLITELLASNLFEVSREDIFHVQEKLKSCPGISGGRLATLYQFVRLNRPSLPEEDESWEADQWINWVVDEYIPYRHWQTQNTHYDAKVEDVVQRFSDWYVEAYTAIHQDREKSLVHLLNYWEDQIKKEVLSLILIVDSLPLTFWDLFQEALAKAGFHRHEIAYRFGPIPSHTEASKPLILSGTWERHDKGYEAILQDRAQKDWGGKRVIYLPNLKALSALQVPEEPAIVLLNFLPPDEVLHSDVELKDSTYEEELHRLFARLADSAKNLFERWPGESQEFSVYVITDHGASKILEEEKASFDSKVVSKLFSDERHRFSYVNKAEAGNIPENLWSLGYRFSQPFVDEDYVYFIPRGHNTVRGLGSGKGYVHGGASPEEVIVPAAIFKPVRPAWKELEARFTNLRIDRKTGKASFYIQRVIPLQIEVQNPNSEAIQILRVDLLSPDADIKGCTTPYVAGSGYGTVEVDCYFNKSALGEEELIIQFTYEISGEEYIKELKAAAEYKSAVTGGFTLKDLK